MVRRKIFSSKHPPLLNKVSTQEAQLWQALRSTAESAVGFWVNFLDLRMDPGGQPLDTAAVSRFVTITRAVSWVESKHGTYGGVTSVRDPLQMGNPNDAWWSELNDPNSQSDRFVGGPNASNYWGGELPGAAYKDPNFLPEAKLSVLADWTLGHNDPNFNNILSFYWGVVYLIYSINVKWAGQKIYQCGDCSMDRMARGAVAYNGGGDPNYPKKILDALELIGSQIDASDVKVLQTVLKLPKRSRDAGRDAIVAEVKNWLGTPHSTLDCSHLVAKVLQNTVNPSYVYKVVAEIRQSPEFLQIDTAEAGDFVSWTSPQHVAVIIDPVSGDFIGSQTSTGVAQSNYLTNPFWSKQTGMIFLRYQSPSKRGVSKRSK